VTCRRRFVAAGGSPADRAPAERARHDARTPDAGALALRRPRPLGATGLAHYTELVWHLRGQAKARQVDDAKIALQHNLGLGGACVVTMYRRD